MIIDSCDLCRTTIFNYHFTCSQCCFEICIDCYVENDKATWLTCINKEIHNEKDFMLVQKIHNDALKTLDKYNEMAQAIEFSTIPPDVPQNVEHTWFCRKKVICFLDPSF